MFCRLPNKSCWILEICPPRTRAKLSCLEWRPTFLFLPNRYKAAFGNHRESHLCSAIDLWIIAFWPEGRANSNFWVLTKLHRTVIGKHHEDTERCICIACPPILPHTLPVVGLGNHKYGYGLWTMYDVYVKPRPDNVWIMQDGFYSAIRASEKLYRNPPTRCIEVCCNTVCCWYQP